MYDELVQHTDFEARARSIVQKRSLKVLDTASLVSDSLYTSGLFRWWIPSRQLESSKTVMTSFGLASV